MAAFCGLRISAAAEAFAEATSQELATKGDIRETELRLAGEMTGIRGEIALLKWMVGFSLALLSAIAIKLFLH